MYEQNKSGIGSIIGTVVIIALIILGGLYFWGKRIEEAKFKQDLVTDDVPEQTENDELSSIEADLNGTNLDNLSAELNAQ